MSNAATASSCSIFLTKNRCGVLEKIGEKHNGLVVASPQPQSHFIAIGAHGKWFIAVCATCMTRYGSGQANTHHLARSLGIRASRPRATKACVVMLVKATCWVCQSHVQEWRPGSTSTGGGGWWGCGLMKRTVAESRGLTDVEDVYVNSYGNCLDLGGKSSFPYEHICNFTIQWQQWQ